MENKILHEELIWLDEKRTDKVWMQNVNGDVFSFVVTPNKMLLRKCVYESDKFLIGKANEKALKENNEIINQIINGISTGASITERMHMNWCEIVCVGPRRKWSKKERKVYGLAEWWSEDFEVGDFVVMPETSRKGRFWRGVLGKEYLVVTETHEPLLLMKREMLNEESKVA